ncbi:MULTISPECIES: hypothetical protein [unclassified Streptomyces]|nr:MULTISPECIES: hypothetical protein [unclassified Streptomyces]MYQ50349.1 hypothetical protein [Streptomyces sp. SID4941]
MAARYRLVGTLRNPGGGDDLPPQDRPHGRRPGRLVEEARSGSRFILT